ncbi:MULTISPECIES: hypothetical protein [Wolbachia]|nr:hypothetical protein [Wolbachia pipientis]RLT59943.1 hypothetical protein WANA31_1202 [Wolbachia endosymbiont of Drosophila ananassae]RLT60340.1 hypothetical protein WANA34_1237 [Wolbachia endosymbiont of Drosophila ananassae]RLT62209.1 hypothetical protein WANA13_0170 [Wolbachia endosymbiont of Drosophila ananassae]
MIFSKARYTIVIPLLVSGIYAKIPRMNRGMTVRGGYDVLAIAIFKNMVE